jgi:hypothetical protein
MLLSSVHTHRQDHMPRTNVKAGLKRLQGSLRAYEQHAAFMMQKTIVIARGQRAAFANDALAAMEPI